jgi:predicted CXXCH cytochrome family protein
VYIGTSFSFSKLCVLLFHEFCRLEHPQDGNLGMRSFLLAVFSLYPAIAPLPVYGAGVVSHDFEERCQSCHVKMPDDQEPGVLVKDIVSLCNDCHGFNQTPRMTFQHPVEIVPGMELPPGLPLDWSGRMTCVTCHDPHAQGASANLHMLRRPEQGNDFCRLCHTQPPQKQPNTHPNAFGLVHPKSSHGVLPTTLDGVIDKRSAECMSCHDGIIAGEAAVKTTGEQPIVIDMGDLSHPIGIDYRKASAKNSGLKPPGSLSPMIILPEGKIGCESCHNFYSNEPHFLVLSNRGSALCLECHDK